MASKVRSHSIFARCTRSYNCPLVAATANCRAIVSSSCSSDLREPAGVDRGQRQRAEDLVADGDGHGERTPPVIGAVERRASVRLVVDVVEAHGPAAAHASRSLGQMPGDCVKADSTQSRGAPTAATHGERPRPDRPQPENPKSAGNTATTRSTACWKTVLDVERRGDDLGHLVDQAELPGQALALEHAAAPLERAIDRREQLRGIEGLGHEREHVLRVALERARQTAVGGNHNGFGRRVLGADQANDVEAGLGAEAQIHDRDAKGPSSEAGRRLRRACAHPRHPGRARGPAWVSMPRTNGSSSTTRTGSGIVLMGRDRGARQRSKTMPKIAARAA